MDKAGSAVATGLRGVVAAASSIGDVNGEKGELIYQGVNIHDLATKSNFEEVVFLLWNGRLPTQAELDQLRKDLAASYELPWQITELIKGMCVRAPEGRDMMDMLRTIISALALFDEEKQDLSREASLRVATRLTARFPVVVAAIERARNNLEIIPPKPELNIATNFLYMMKGEMAEALDARLFDVALLLQ